MEVSVQCVSDGAIGPIPVLHGEHLPTLTQVLQNHNPSIPSHGISVVRPTDSYLGCKKLQCWKRDEL